MVNTGNRQPEGLNVSNPSVGARLCLVPLIPTGSTCHDKRREAQPRTNDGAQRHEGTKT